jgi:hypothetical protein
MRNEIRKNAVDATLFDFDNYREYLTKVMMPNGPYQQKGSNLSRWARRLGHSSPSLLSMVLKGDRTPSDELLEKLILELKDEKQIVEMKSKLQLAELTIKLDELKGLLSSKDYENLALELGGIVWTKNSKDYDTESIEREIFKSFLKKKEAINNQMPEENRIEIEKEYSL